ncbi:hypothetical protein SKAU_G00370370 [Synaphobranchus kaupii]|uniref:C2H2-type domain-containing protein n=1 Tax=Synaphobranchus kaupii TaxID=118154 RepID=A0A9Q1IFX1_SYNKA|nr:hypothetical protein SKAU_G00370370 [Synaphobranchus kaupii]
MPRAFLVKKASVSPGKRNWSEVPDHERGDIYIPVPVVRPLFREESEASPAESAPFFFPRHDHGKQTLFPERVPHTQAHTAELPSSTAQGQEQSPEPEDQESTYIRSKIKVTTGELPGEALASPSLAAQGAPAFACQVCQKTFQFLRMLNRHLKCHNETKRHPCNFCGKGFNDTFDLKRHVRTHTDGDGQKAIGVRPYKCGLCDKAFTQRCSLESHMKKIHGVSQQYAYKERRNKLYVCEECGHTAHSQESLLLHLHTLHPHSALLRGKGRKLGAGGVLASADRESLSPGSPPSQHCPDSDDAAGSGGR